MAGLNTIVGGEVGGDAEMLSESRNQAIGHMIAQAQAMGADAVVNDRFTTSKIAQGMSETLAYGTAVKLSWPLHSRNDLHKLDQKTGKHRSQPSHTSE